MRSLNEHFTKIKLIQETEDIYIKELSLMSRISKSALEKFTTDNNLDTMDLMQQVGQMKIELIDLVKAVSGTPNNKYYKEIIKKVSKVS